MPDQPTRLWDKGQPLDELIHRFTVGDDPIWDLKLVHADLLGSAAHAHTLHRAGLLSDAELKQLLAGLRAIDTAHKKGRFEIPRQLEDCHTAIEAELTRICGDTGKKIHTGRSRNDQVATAMRLYLRTQVVAMLELMATLVRTALDRIERDGRIDMPGYTHMQPAMPSSVGQWLHAHVEAALDQMRAALALSARLDSCPLGTGAGFGVPLDLDRAHTAELLGFARVQRSPIDVQNSRGRMELYFARLAADVGAFIEKLASDMLLFSTAEFGFFTLPSALTTGSSIMPQKRNPDVLELMRGKSARLRARAIELDLVIAKLPSSYHRDLQLTKEPAFRAADELDELLRVTERVVATFDIHASRLTAAMRPELFATEAALQLARSGTPFREAYRRIATELAANRFERPPVDTGTQAPQYVPPATVAELRAELESLSTTLAPFSAKLNHAEKLLTADITD